MGRKVLAMFYVGTDKLVHLDVYETEEVKAKPILEELRRFVNEFLEDLEKEEQERGEADGAQGAGDTVHR